MLTSIKAILSLLTAVIQHIFGVTFWLTTGGFLSAPQNKKHLVFKREKMEIPGRIVVYSIVGCPHCMKAKNSLQEKGLPYMDISLDKFPQCRGDVAQRTGKHTVPQIFFNDIHVGGNEDLDKVMQNKEEWEKLVTEVKTNAPGRKAPEIPDMSSAVSGTTSSGFICEPDEYAQLVEDLKLANIIKDHRSGLTVHKKSFTGSAFVNWAVKSKGIERERAIEMGQALIDQHFGNDVKKSNEFKDDETYYRLIEDDETTALNAGTSTCAPRPANEIGEEIRRLILKLYSAFLSADGKRVNYAGIGGSSEFTEYKKLVVELVRVDVTGIGREEKLAFFINIYNALVIHANIERGPPTNLWQRYKFFNTVRYIIGGHTYSLQDIENGVLRGNRKGVGMFTRPFGQSDPRLKVALDTAEPLIHFALVCGAKSCPPIKTYSANGVMEQLRIAAQSFMEGEDAVSIDTDHAHVKLSMIFKWYKEDFGTQNRKVVEWIYNNIGEGDKKDNLKKVMDQKLKVSHMSYDWGVNSK